MWGESVTPPTRLFHLHARDRISVLVLGGTPGRRLRVAHAFHTRSRLVRGPLVCLDAARDEAVLRAGLRGWLGTLEDGAANPLTTAERGTLFVDSIARLSPASQRLLLEFSSRHLNASSADSARPWIGRLIAGDGRRLRAALATGAFSMPLYDALDKVRLDLPAIGRPLGAHRLTA